MKKALVLTLAFALGIGFAAFAASPFSGSWYTLARFNVDPDFEMGLFYSELAVDYTAGGWTFSSISQFVNATGFDNQYFLASGSLGALTAGSYLNFNPATPAFEMWLTGAKLSIAGVDLYGFFDLEDTGSGWLLGAAGTAGELTIRAETYFNLTGSLIGGLYTFDGVVGGFADYAYSSCEGTTIAEDAFSLQTDSYCFCWSGLDVELSFPFTCIDEVVVDVSFDATSGFDSVLFQLNDIELGVDWLTIDDFDIKFTTQTKSVAVDIDIALGGVCVTPYWEVTKDTAWTITGFELYAFGLAYSWNGLSFSDITLLDTTNYILTTSGAVVPIGYKAYYCTVDYDEMFQISYSADSCCGGAYELTVTNWFDIEGSSAGIFGWMETEADFSVGVGSNFTIGAGVDVSTKGVDSFEVSFDVGF